MEAHTSSHPCGKVTSGAPEEGADRFGEDWIEFLPLIAGVLRTLRICENTGFEPPPLCREVDDVGKDGDVRDVPLDIEPEHPWPRRTARDRKYDANIKMRRRYRKQS